MKKRTLTLITAVCISLSLLLGGCNTEDNGAEPEALPADLPVVTPGDEPAETAAEPTPEDDRIQLSFTFDDFAERGEMFFVGDSAEMEWYSGFGHDDDNSLKLTNTGRSYTSNRNAVHLWLPEDDILPAGGTYNVSAWFYAPADANPDKGTLLGTPSIVINGAYEADLGVSKFPADTNTARPTMPIGEWVEMNVTMPVAVEPIFNIDFRLFTNDAETHPDVWYIDNIVIAQIGEIVNMAPREWDLSLPSLDAAFADYFAMGNIMEPAQVRDDELTSMFKHHYSFVTAENAMKPSNMAPQKGTFNFDGADAIVNWAQDNGIQVVGHTLVWHSQSARWLTTGDDGEPLTRAEARQNMEDYINEVAGRYAGRIYSWDVVNEAFTDSPGPAADWRNVLRKSGGGGSPWYMAYANGADEAAGEDGSDYLYDAFVFARIADPAAILYYNDFNETEGGKRQAMAMMVEELNEKWESDPRNTEPGRLLIEGIGMQAHYWTDNLRAADVEASIQRFIETGAVISVTELDIPIGRWNGYGEPTEENFEKQADLYRQVFEVYMNYAEHIERVTI